MADALKIAKTFADNSAKVSGIKVFGITVPFSLKPILTCIYAELAGIASKLNLTPVKSVVDLDYENTISIACDFVAVALNNGRLFGFIRKWLLRKALGKLTATEFYAVYSQVREMYETEIFFSIYQSISQNSKILIKPSEEIQSGEE